MQIKEWDVGDNEYLCGLLSFIDKWWIIFLNQKNLGRYGHSKGVKLSCILDQLQDGSYHTYAVEGKWDSNFDISKLV